MVPHAVSYDDYNPTSLLFCDVHGSVYSSIIITLLIGFDALTPDIQVPLLACEPDSYFYAEFHPVDIGIMVIPAALHEKINLRRPGFPVPSAPFVF